MMLGIVAGHQRKDMEIMTRQPILIHDETTSNPIAEVIERAAHPTGPQPNGIPLVEEDIEIVDPADVEGMRRARGYAGNPKGQKMPIINVRKTGLRGSLIELDGALALNEKNARAAAAASGVDSAMPMPAAPSVGGRDGWIAAHQAAVRGFMPTPATPQATGTDAVPRMSGRDEWIAKQQCAAPGESVLLPESLGK